MAPGEHPGATVIMLSFSVSGGAGGYFSITFEQRGESEGNVLRLGWFRADSGTLVSAYQLTRIVPTGMKNDGNVPTSETIGQREDCLPRQIDVKDGAVDLLLTEHFERTSQPVTGADHARPHVLHYESEVERQYGLILNDQNILSFHSAFCH